MQRHVQDETGRFIPVAPGWTVYQWWNIGSERERDSDELVGWLLVDGGYRDDYYVPAIWGDEGRLEPLDVSAYTEVAAGVSLHSVMVRPTGNPPRSHAS